MQSANGFDLEFTLIRYKSGKVEVYIRAQVDFRDELMLMRAALSYYYYTDGNIARWR